jgi:hypothetical protein
MTSAHVSSSIHSGTPTRAQIAAVAARTSARIEEIFVKMGPSLRSRR